MIATSKRAGRMRKSNAKLLADLRAYNSKSVIPVTSRPTVRSVNRKVKKIEKRQELKHIDTTYSVAMVSDPIAANILLLNGMMQGLPNTNRVADRVTFTSIQIRGLIDASSNVAGKTAWRLIVFRDIAPNGLAPGANNLLDVTTITSYFNAPYNQDFSDRFRVIMDKRGIINPNVIATSTLGGGVTTTTNTVLGVSQKVKLKWKLNFITNYGLGNAGTIADISRNSVYALLISDKTTASGVGPVLTFGTRMYYKDD